MGAEVETLPPPLCPLRGVPSVKLAMLDLEHRELFSFPPTFTPRMRLKGSRDSRWEARLLPELIRIIGPHFARAGCGSHRGANSREACKISLPRRNS
eukprot:gene8781-biopygen6151